MSHPRSHPLTVYLAESGVTIIAASQKRSIDDTGFLDMASQRAQRARRTRSATYKWSGERKEFIDSHVDATLERLELSLSPTQRLLSGTRVLAANSLRDYEKHFTGLSKGLLWSRSFRRNQHPSVIQGTSVGLLAIGNPCLSCYRMPRISSRPST